ncbi:MULTISPECIES: PP2C family serine/threonine-protein phosphatase [Deinococcus]|jgi:protein phosphatase|uniref:Protein phosphatase n=2 Tax=Deinococcus soli (ex Cha et al. 2016) TaxID=1309411 RepID=A0A0F7JQ15_9DEIO|nr:MULTISPECIES: protein phosphatase 2C domain-containing protein [Deinococcus]AKH17434.1 serine/threonine protein phosphatase [Deinococcus soli (ex Cha et al. 2016)]MDK2012679.1 protein phosphatase 2C domain-containing protein [Deinococcus sp. 43]MDR6219304.1 protein phosphatase [Deinococcus soli (ex Cha et al. 2016)]MDR6329553.1 protein phosphatase [Deinococcus soli (ex Cha et al. 2016)]MDR6752213.1 protein phosphatase [Deinococcus soli (ex Cha et al. 2016)]
MRAPATPSLTSGLLTDVGRQRQGGVNQDAALALDLPQGGLYAVADGMGGHAAGELAANLALDALSQHYLDGRGAPPARLAQAVQAANIAVLRHAVGEYVGMGTTLLAALVDRGAVLIAHVGDSRAYLLRGSELHRLTEDHSWVAEQVRLGHMTEAEARDHQWRSVVSNALGGEERVRLELHGLPTQAGDRLLLCSDGLSSVVTDDELCALLARPLPPETTARLLVNAANDGGGPDNITALIVDVQRDAALPSYALPARRDDGPMYIDVLLSTQRGNSLMTYLLLMIAYFTLLGIMLLPERRTVLGALGTAILLALLIGQRVTQRRRAHTPLGTPSASLHPAAPAPAREHGVTQPR